MALAWQAGNLRVKKCTCLRSSIFDIPSSAVQISTTWGTIGVELIDGKVGRCALPFLSTQPNNPFSIVKGRGDPVSTFIAALFSGEPATPPVLAELAGTDFQQQVWRAIARIPAGRTQTYGELSRAIGRPRSYRAVANACGKNPVPLFIPCHRVVAANGKIGGFSAGLAWKRLLLATNRA